jgi:hypothetical protein
MKSIVFIIGLLLIAGCAHLSTPSSPDSIDGTWKGVYNSGGMDGLPPLHFIFNFKSDGKSLTGEACDTTTRPDEWVQLKELKREGDYISFTSTPSPAPEIGKMTFRFEGIKEGDEIKLTFKTEINGQIAGESHSFTIKREK